MTGDKLQPSVPKVSQAAWALVSEALLVLGALINFVVLLRLLSVEDYGLVGSVHAIAVPASAAAAMGAPFLLQRSAARGANRGRAMSYAATVTVTGATVLVVCLTLIQPWLLRPASWLPFGLLLYSTACLVALQELSFALATGIERLELGALFRSYGVMTRLIGLAAFYYFGSHTFASWAWFALFSNLAALGLQRLTIKRAFHIDISLMSPKNWLVGAKDGFGFAMNGLSEGVLEATDRPILANSGFAADAGHYSAAGRVLSFAILPMIAVMRSIAGRLLRSGEQGVAGALATTKEALAPVVALAVASGAGLFICAPAVPAVLGAEWTSVVPILRWLAIVPLVKSLQFLGGNALDAAQRQFTRFWLTIGAAGLNLGLNIALIPRYSWKAAVGTTVLAETLLAAALWIALATYARRETAR